MISQSEGSVYCMLMGPPQQTKQKIIIKPDDIYNTINFQFTTLETSDTQNELHWMKPTIERQKIKWDTSGHSADTLRTKTFCQNFRIQFQLKWFPTFPIISKMNGQHCTCYRESMGRFTGKWNQIRLGFKQHSKFVTRIATSMSLKSHQFFWVSAQASQP